MSSQDIHIRFTRDLLTAVDEAAAGRCQTRSQFIRDCIVLRLNNQIITVPPDPEEIVRDLLQDIQTSV